MPLNTRAKARFINLVTFGATPELVRSMGDNRGAWLSQQIDIPAGRSHYSWGNEIMDSRDRAPRPDQLFGIMDGQEWNVNHLWRAYIEAPDQVRKRVGAALLEIFVVNARVGSIGIGRNVWTTLAYVDMLEQRAFGNFYDLLWGVSTHPAMGNFLSHIGNEKAVYGPDGTEVQIPDENYAREVLQLFSIGLHELNRDGTLRLDEAGQPIETYTQDDIFNLARVFTGWDLDTRIADRRAQLRDPMAPDPSKHSPEAKRFLGLTIPAGTGPDDSLRLALRHIVAHPNVGPFLGKQLIQRLVTSNPTPAYVDRVAATFDDNGQGVRGDLRAVIMAILTDREALAGPPVHLRPVRGKVREPMIRLTAVARYLGLSSPELFYPIANLTDVGDGIGQSPLKSPSVFNFFRPGYSPPASLLAEQGMVAPELQLATGSQVIGSINTINRFVDRALDYMERDGVTFRRLANLAAGGVDQLVDDAVDHLIGRPLHRSYRAELIDHLEAIAPHRRWRIIRATVQGVASSPEFLVQR